MYSANHLELIWELAKRELSERHAGSAFGLVWAVIHPLAMMAIYLFVFGYIFKARIPASADVAGSYSLYFLSGFVSWFAFSETLSKGPGIVQQHAALVKQIVFPVDILPLKSVLTVSITQAVFLVLILIYILIFYQSLNLMMPLIVVILAGQFFMMSGIAYILASIGLFFRDTKDIIQIFLTGGLFLTPVIYTPDVLQGILGYMVLFNPLSYPIFAFQDVLFFGRFEHPFAWLVFGVLTFVLFFSGRWLFAKLSPMFGDAL